jgi:serine/threonine protein kinase
MLELIGKTAGKYQIMERAGQGGMGAIYKALDTTTNQIVALKVLYAAMALDPKIEARFAREIEVLRSLDHPHILPILDYGNIQGVPYIVMPFYPHGTLRELINQGISRQQGIRIIKQVSDALEYAHGRAVIHRDVKPSNILLDEKGNAVLSDFGLAYLPDSSMSLTGSALIGTPAYMSPEQCRGEEINGASDQYSLAVVIYEMVTNKTPFDADSPMAMIYKHINDPLPYPRAVNRNVPAEVEEVLLKALSKDQAQRYPSLAAFNRAFLVAAVPEGFGLSPFAIRWRKLRSRFKRFRQRMNQSIDNLRNSPRFRRGVRVALTLAVFLAIPLGFWAIVGFGVGSGEADAAPGLDATSIVATVFVGFEQTLAAGGEGLSEDDMATAVQATIASMIVDAAITPTPTKVESTPTASPSSSPTPTNTPVPTATQPPTATRRPATKTPVPPPTLTPVPTATKTLIPDPCENLAASSFNVEGQYARWLVTNGRSEAVAITTVYIDWPQEPNHKLKRIKFDGSVVYDELDYEPPTQVNFGEVEGLSIGASQSKPLLFEFYSTAALEDYALKLIFDNGCTLWDYR